MHLPQAYRAVLLLTVTGGCFFIGLEWMGVRRDSGQEITPTSITESQAFGTYKRKKLPDKALINSWRAAQEEVGLIGATNTGPANATQLMARAFNALKQPQYVNEKGARRCAYVRTPKSANNNVGCNLDRHKDWQGSWWNEGRQQKDWTNLFGNWGKVKHKYSPIDKNYGGHPSGLPKVFSELMWFTFVREPMARFVSAYTEIEYRNREKSYGFGYENYKLGTPERFMQFVLWLLKGGLYQNENVRKGVSWHTSQIYHSFNQATILRDHKQVQIGFIEKMPEHWIAMQRWAGLEPAPLDRTCGQHVTSKDPFGTTAAAREALESNAALTRAICWILLPDYYAFHYPLPPGCSGIVAPDTFVQ